MRAAGIGVSINVVSCVLIVSTVTGNKAFYLDDGVDFRISGSSMIGFDNAIYVPTGITNPCLVNGSGTIINSSGTYDIFIGSSNTNGSWFGGTIYTKVYIPTDSLFFINGSDATIIKVQKSGGNFTSIVSALAAISDNTSTKRYIIDVGAGNFIEPEIVMKQFISIRGAGRATIIRADASNHHVIRGCDFSEIDSVIITGAGTGYAALYQESATGTANSALICRNILFGVNDTLVKTYGNVGQAHVILYNSLYGGAAQFNYGFYATNNNNTLSSKITLIGTTSQDFTSPMPSYVAYASGTNCTVSINSFNAIHNGTIESGTIGFKVDNSGFLRLVGCTVRGFDTAITSINSGSAPQIIASGFTITDCTTDINIQHPDTLGAIDVLANRTKTIVNGTPPISLFIVDSTNTGIAFSGPFYYSKTDFNNLTDISNLITNTPTMGIISGGILSVSSGLTLELALGRGYNETPEGILRYQTWTSSTIELPINTNSYISINSNGILSYSSSYPNSINNIILGLVSTNATDIIYIQQTPLNSYHTSNYTSNLLRNAIGPIYSSGSSVAEAGIRGLNVTQGSYFFSSAQFLPTGGNPITFNAYYRSVTPGLYTSVLSQTTVPNTNYDDGSGTLQPLTTSYYTKHLLLLLGGPSEDYALIYCQDEYSSLGAAEAAGLPITPSFITDAFVRVVSIIVQQGTTNIVSFIDERPRIGFASSSTTGVITVHGDLIGLGSNDHPQYLLADGGAPGMSGNLNMNGNNIVDVGTINSINIASHGSRHGINSSDPVPTPTLSSEIASVSGTASSIGISDKIPRADHVHFHGNLIGGSLHSAVIAAGASGFMTGSDKTKLDGIATGATNNTTSDISPVNVNKSTASAGISTEVSRVDHKHDISTGAASGLTSTTTNTEGSATTLARSDHTHSISSAVPVIILPDEEIAIGNSTSFSRADHIHNIPTGIAAGINANSTNQQGAAATFSRSNHIHAIASGVPSNQTIAASVATGTSANFARADHIHTFSTGTPVDISTSNSEGNSTSFSRSNHVHAHGSQTDGSLHATVIAAGASGFMTGSDKTKLDGIATGATNTTSSDILPVNVTKSTASAGISDEVSRVDHKHDISTGTAINLSATTTNTEGSASSLSRSDHVHAILSGVPSNQTIAVSVATGTSSNFARADHIHTFSTDVPNSIGSSNSEGISTSFSRADHVHNINLSGPISSTGTTTSITSQTGTGSTFVMNNSPTLITPIIGSATGSSLLVTGTLKSGTGLILEDTGVGTNTITIQAPTPLASSYILTLPVDDGTSGQVLSTDGSGDLSWITGGDVLGPGSATDNALTRFNSTTGKLIKNSSVLLSNAGALSGITSIDMSGQLNSTVITGTAPFTVSSTTLVTNLASQTSQSSSTSVISDDVTTNSTMYPTWVTSNSGNLAQKVSSTKLSFNPSTGLLSSTGFSGSLSNSTGLPLTSGVTGILPVTNGGTGINNGSNTITLGGNLTTSGSFNTTITSTATTSVTLPTSGTLLNNSLATNNIYVGNSGVATSVSMSGDATIVASGAITLSTVNVSSGSTTLSSITTNAKGLVTSNTTGNLIGDVSSTGLTTSYNNNVPLTKGGTNASLTASNGGIFYSTASAGAILGGVASENHVLLSGLSSAPSWSTATYPSSTTTNQILYSSSTNVIGGLATVNSSGLLTNGSGVPGWVAYTGSGSPVLNNSPILIAPNIGSATGTSLNISGQIVTGGPSLNFTTLTVPAANSTLTASQVISGYVDLSFAAAAPNTVTLPTATAIINAITNAKVGTSFKFYIRRSANTTQTIALGTGITALTGSILTVVTGSVRGFMFLITNVGTPAITLLPLGTATY